MAKKIENKERIPRKQIQLTANAGKTAVLNAVVENVMNAVTSRSALVREMLDPRRDLSTDCGYIDNPTPSDFNDMYEREGIAKRCVHFIPEECWKVTPLVYETEESDETEFEKTWDELQKKFKLFSVLARADALSGIGEFGVILFGMNDGKDLSEELPPSENNELIFLRVFDQSVVTIDETENDTKNERFDKPIKYSIDFQKTKDGTTSSASQKVHWTRVLHIADNCRMDETRGVSRLKPVFNRLQDLRKLLGGSAEMFWQGAFPGLSFEVDPRLIEAGAAELDTGALKEELQDYINGLQRWISTVGVHVNKLSSDVADPKSHIAEQLRAIAISLNIPYRVFMGTEEGKLAADQDAKAWAERISYRQNNYLTPNIVLPFVTRLQELNVLPETAEEIEIDWPDMLSPSDQEKADTAKTMVEAMKAYVQGGVEEIMLPFHFLTRILGLEADEAQTILDEVEEELAKEDKEREELEVTLEQERLEQGIDEDVPQPQFDKDGNPIEVTPMPPVGKPVPVAIGAKK